MSGLSGIEAAIACLLSWVVGQLYGAYKWERHTRNRPLRELIGFGGRRE